MNKQQDSRDNSTDLQQMLAELRADPELQAFLRKFPLNAEVEAIQKVASMGLPAVVDSSSLVQAVYQNAGLDELLGEDDTPSLLPKRHGPPFDDLLLNVPLHFVDRSDEREWLMQRLSPGHGGNVVALTGMGGIGKTALTAHVIQQLRRQGRFGDGMVVIICKDTGDANEVLSSVLTRFDPYRRRQQAPDSAGFIELAQQLISGKDVLIVLDNVEPGLDLERVIPPLRAAGALVVLTARQVLSHAIVPLENMLFLDLLSEESAVELFARSLGRGSAQELTSDERVATLRIVMALERHSLAVRLAGSYAADVRRDLADLASDLENPQRAIELPQGEIPNALSRVFDESIKSLDADTSRLFTMLAAFETEEFGRKAVEALGAALGLPAPEICVNTLALRSLFFMATDNNMPRGSDRERLRLHLLLRNLGVREFEKLPLQDRDDAHRAIAQYFARYVRETDISAYSADRRNIAGAIEWAYDHHEPSMVAVLCEHMGAFWRSRGRTQEALTYLPRGVEAADEVAEHTHERGDQLRSADLALLYGRALWLGGDPEAAENAVDRSLALRKVLGDRRGEGESLRFLGRIARRRGRQEEAEVHFAEALKIAQEEQDRIGEAVCIGHLGRIALARGQFDDAQRHFEVSLRLARETRDRRGEGIVLALLGLVAQSRRELESAKNYYQQSLEVRREVNDLQGRGADLFQLGRLARDQGDLETAQNYFNQAYKIAQEIQDLRSEGVIISSQGQTALSAGRVADAAEYFARSLPINRVVQDRRVEGADLSQLGRIAHIHGQMDVAAQYFRQALGIAREVQNRSGECTDLVELGHIARERGNYEEAERNYKEAHALAMRLKHEDSAANALIGLAQVSEVRGDLAEAERMARESNIIMHQVLDRRGECESLTLLGRIMIVHKNHREATRYLEDALVLARKVQDKKAEASVLFHLAQVAEMSGKLDDARARYQDSLLLSRKLGYRLATAETLLAFGQLLVSSHHSQEEGCAMIGEAILHYSEMGLPEEHKARTIQQALPCNG